MFKDKWRLFLIINSVLMLFVLFFCIITHFTNKEKIVTVDNLKLFDEFKMTKELKSIGNKEYSSKKKYLDSLYLKLQEQNLDNNIKEVLMKEFVAKRDLFDQFNQSFAAEESDKIWKRIESYSKVYAKEKKYTLMISSENSREVLYADESVDVTNEFLLFINKKYEGL